MSHRSDNKYLHCTKCVEDRSGESLTIFVTPIGALGIQCSKHPEFLMTIPNDKVSDHLMSIAMQPCTNPDCKCEPEVSN